jgi:tetratricopeptide (TPR) repeat protein
MFFPRLRNQAKWAFVFLIVVFAGGFIFLGVGSGGLDLGQLLRDAFGNKGPSTGSLSQAQENVREHPASPAAYLRLADVAEKKGLTDEAIGALSRYTALRPKDGARLQHLGELELAQADRYFREAQLASLGQAESSAGNTFGPAALGNFGKSLVHEARDRFPAGFVEVPDRGKSCGGHVPEAREAQAERSGDAVLTRPGRRHAAADIGRDRRIQAAAQARPRRLDEGTDSGADPDSPAIAIGLDSAPTGTLAQ